MTKICENKNRLLRDGTSQSQRTLKALLPSYVSVDERSLNDLIDFVNEFSAQINFYDINNTVNGDWTSFFENQLIDETTQKTQPHYALFIAFLQLFKYAQEDLNTITQRHLEFYYKDVLQIEEKEAIPDQVFVIFELANQTANYVVEKNTGLNGGEDATGVDLTYLVNKNVSINRAQAVDFKALFYNKDNDARLYASPIANSANGTGEQIETEEPKWKTFGTISDPTAAYNSPVADRPQADVGFAFASPLLSLAEGNRTVTIELTVTNLFGLTTTELTDAFNVYFSGEEGWVSPIESSSKLPQDSTFVASFSQKKITIIRTLTEGQEAIVPYNQEVLIDPFITEWPVAKIVVDTENNSFPYIYAKLKKLVIQTAKITVDVDGVKNVVVQNDQSKFDASKPFMPFGNKPVLSSSFYIGSTEVFSKQLSKLDLNITWKGLPLDSTGFKGYYKNYIPQSENNKRRNGQFRANIEVLNGREWKNLIPASSTLSRLFDPATDQKLNSFRLISVANNSLGVIQREPDMPEVTQYGNSVQRGFMRLQLANVDFGHSDYQVSFATQAIKVAANTSADATNQVIQASAFTPVGGTVGTSGLIGQVGQLSLNSNPSVDLVNEPYTPLISEMSLSYTSSEIIDLTNSPANNSEEAFANRIDQFFQVGAFGARELHPYTFETQPFITLFPVYNDEGSLYIGIQDLVPPTTLSILFQVAEGSENPDLSKQDVNWSYLSGDEWFEFPKANILSDSTNGLITSGIIEYNIPKKASANNTILPNGLYWLKAAVTDDSAAIAEMISIQAQAVEATFQDNENDPQHLAESLPSESIDKLVNSVSQINSVSQPYASFGGAEAEDSTAYFTRVSERLRHKNRAIMIWDYEHLVLENFPKSYKVKCLNHTKYISSNDLNEISPGNVSLVVISNLQNKNAVNPLKPKTSLATLSAIQELIKGLNPPCAELYVKNPLYEEIVTHFNVRLKVGYDPGFYLNLLNEDLKQFLAPWAYGGQNISFGGRIHSSVIVNFIDEQEYVDFITCFTMDQITAEGDKKNIQEAVAVTSASILTSAVSHKINLLETDDCECNDNVVEIPVPSDDCACDEKNPDENTVFGVGGSKVGGNFIVGNGKPVGDDGIDEMEIGEDFDVQ